MKVLALAGYDSFLNTARLLAPYFEKHGATVEFGLVKARSKAQITDGQVRDLSVDPLLRNVDIRRFCEEGRFRDFDIILACLEGLSSRRLFHYLARQKGKTPFVISLYPGLLLRNAFEGHAARAAADRIWLNCRRDVDAYQAMCRSFGMDGSNARLFGPASVLETIERGPDASRSGPVVFFEQAVIPRFYDERKHMVRSLFNLARRYPDRQVLIKARVAGKQATLHRTWHAIDGLMDEIAAEDGGRPENLALTGEPASQLLSRAGCCLTVTSTVAVEAIHAGVPTAILCDAGAIDDYGLQYFFGSGLLRSVEQLDLDNLPVPDPGWLQAFTHDPESVIDDLVLDCLANLDAERPSYRQQSVALGAQGFQDMLLEQGAEYFLAQGYRKRKNAVQAFGQQVARWLGRR